MDSDGFSGGLALLWQKDNCVSLQSFAQRHIDVLVARTIEQKDWRFTRFYGDAEVSER